MKKKMLSESVIKDFFKFANLGDEQASRFLKKRRKMLREGFEEEDMDMGEEGDEMGPPEPDMDMDMGGEEDMDMDMGGGAGVDEAAVEAVVTAIANALSSEFGVDVEVESGEGEDEFGEEPEMGDEGEDEFGEEPEMGGDEFEADLGDEEDMEELEEYGLGAATGTGMRSSSPTRRRAPRRRRKSVGLSPEGGNSFGDDEDPVKKGGAMLDPYLKDDDFLEEEKVKPGQEAALERDKKARAEREKRSSRSARGGRPGPSKKTGYIKEQELEEAEAPKAKSGGRDPNQNPTMRAAESLLRNDSFINEVTKRVSKKLLGR